MNRAILLASAVAFFISCGGGDKKSGNNGKSAEGKNDALSNDLSSNPDYKKGLALVSPPADCFTCHHVDEAVTGPAYRDVANKYADMPDTIVTHLAKKIISGGKGNWGEIPMVPHLAVSLEDAEAMVKYILLLKSK